ncbi:patatin-like phospholipase family protein [Leptospira idonii]|uniref:Esterase n=1 Tax=Leptospira idonii TaxID=1193500 RepID=A0A4R9LZW6_9LEPT|nr:cyclic nucleotide-binding and patatin-like phospholipase domain-containing protein [Leptospira idonii]TGN18499.1 esterase [Leptospira idonii]
MKDLDGKIHLVSGLPLFRNLNKKELHWVADAVQIVEAKRDEILYKKGGEDQSLYLILSGSVSIFNPAKGETKEEELQILKKGEYFGIHSLLTGENHSHNAKTLSDSRFLVLSPKEFRELLKKIPILSTAFSKMLTKTLRNELLGSKEFFRNSVVCILHSNPTAINYYSVLLAEAIEKESGKKSVILRFNQPISAELEKSGYIKQYRFRDPDKIKDSLGRHYSTHSFIFLEVFPDDPPELIQSLLDESDNVDNLVTFGKDLKKEFPTVCEFLSEESRSNDVLYHETPIDTIIDHGKLEIHIRRKARELSGVQVGLALGGGAALGLAQIGVMKVFEEEGLSLDMISGTSIGAIVGAFWASGLGYKGIKPLLAEIDSFFKMLKLVDLSFPGQGLLHGKNVRNMLEKYLGDLYFEDLPVKLRLISCDISNRQEIVLSEGKVLDAVMASISIPGVFVPQPQENGKTYVDGGIVNPLPVSPLTKEGVERIIAINSMPSSRDQMKTNKLLNLNVLDIIVNSLYSLQYRIGKYSAQEADVYLNPILPNSNWFEFWRSAEFIELGERVARESLSEIKKLYI